MCAEKASWIPEDKDSVFQFFETMIINRQVPKKKGILSFLPEHLATKYTEEQIFGFVKYRVRKGKDKDNKAKAKA